MSNNLIFRQRFYRGKCVKSLSWIVSAQYFAYTDVQEAPVKVYIGGRAVFTDSVHLCVGRFETDSSKIIELWEGDKIKFPNDPDMAGHEFRVVWDHFGWWLQSETYNLVEIHLGAINSGQWDDCEIFGNEFQEKTYVK